MPGVQDSSFADTDVFGRGTLTELPARPVHVHVMVMNARSAWLPPLIAELVAEGQEVVLDLRRGARLTGRITGPAEPILGASIEAWHGDAAVAFALSDAEGRFGLTIDPAEHFPLLICARVGRRYSEVALLDRLPTTPLELNVPER